MSNVERLTIEALDPNQPPHFKGSANAWQFSRCDHLSLRHLKLSGQTSNGLNLDDGGKFDSPTIGITISNVEVSDIGPRGNCDGIKCSGLDRLTIEHCRISGWGGQGIDMVGCHDSVIRHCEFVGKPGFTASAGVQTKGGSSDIRIEGCQFNNAGERPLNLGGSTDLNLFRPSGAMYEAKRITTTNNRIEGSLCAVAFVGIEGAEFNSNTILYPEKWVFRILQETRAEGFAACSNVTIANNQIIFRRSIVQTEVNIGEGTKPETFRFAGNRWYAEDRPQTSQPRLPTQEANGTYGTDPR